MKQKATFNSLSRAMLDAWIAARSPLDDPEQLYLGLVGSMSVKMAVNLIEVNGEDPRDWVFRGLKSYGVQTRLLDIKLHMRSGPFGHWPDQDYLERSVYPVFSKVVESGSPYIDFVHTKLAGLNLGYHRLMLPQKTPGRPEWLLTFTDGRFLLAPPSKEPPIDIIDEAIIQLLCEGQTAKECAEILGFSARTIEHRIEKLKSRYDARNVVHLTAMMVAQRLSVTPPPAPPSQDAAPPASARLN